MDNAADSSQAAKGMTQRCGLSSRAPPVGRDTGKRIIYTGPDGTGDYRSWLPAHTTYVGATCSPKEGTSEAMYLWRPAPDNPPVWLKRHCIVGEIGWGVVDFGYYLNRRGIPSSKPIKTEIFPPAEEFEMIQRYTDPGIRTLTVTKHSAAMIETAYMVLALCGKFENRFWAEPRNHLPTVLGQPKVNWLRGRIFEEQWADYIFKERINIIPYLLLPGKK